VGSPARARYVLVRVGCEDIAGSAGVLQGCKVQARTSFGVCVVMRLKPVGVGSLTDRRGSCQQERSEGAEAQIWI
jgi:hypothetical protein